MRLESFLSGTLRDLAAANTFREPDDGGARRAVDDAAARLGYAAIDASSNDYLGLGSRAVSRETLGKAGAGASRLIHGTTDEHLALEAALAEWVGADSALLFSSTYAANVGLISSLGVSESVIISDATNHASLIDGARLAKAQVHITPHLDVHAVESALKKSRNARACWVVTESYFSMDGDGPDLVALREMCTAYDACLIVDEAHALGVFGPQGAGRCAELGVSADVLVGALGKAVGAQGGFVASSEAMRAFLWNRARSFVFSTAPSPQQTCMTLAQLRSAQMADELRQRLAINSRTLRGLLTDAGLPIAAGSFGPVISVILHDNERVLAASARLREAGVLAQAIRPPTVPAGAARLRLTVKATFDEAQIARLAETVTIACAS